jgi:hypothetical protein
VSIQSVLITFVGIFSSAVCQLETFQPKPKVVSASSRPQSTQNTPITNPFETPDSVETTTSSVHYIEDLRDLSNPFLTPSSDVTVTIDFNPFEEYINKT